MKRSKQGSYIAEAAVVLPVIIFAIITVILIVMFFYEESVEESRMHIALRCQAGQMTGKIIYYIDGTQAEAADLWNGDISSNNRGLYQNVSGKGNVLMKRRGILWNALSRELHGSWLAVDPAKIRRLK